MDVDEARTKVKGLNKDVSDATLTVSQLFVLTSRLSGLLRRMGLPDNVAYAMSMFMRLLFTIRLVRSALLSLELATPYGWIKAGLGFATAGIVTIDVMDEVGSR